MQFKLSIVTFLTILATSFVNAQHDDNSLRSFDDSFTTTSFLSVPSPTITVDDHGGDLSNTTSDTQSTSTLSVDDNGNSNKGNDDSSTHTNDDSSSQTTDKSNIGAINNGMRNHIGALSFVSMLVFFLF